jgi:hypothetical protein
MKKTIGLVLGMAFLVACQKSEVVSEFTGNQITYGLQAASQYPISGTVTIKERKDGAVSVLVKLTGTSPGTTSPVHLHLGDLSTPKASVAALLSPVTGKTGQSETILNKLADESPVTYTGLLTLNACIKVHLSDIGAESNIILAAGNIGSASTKAIVNGQVEIAPCKGTQD